MRHPAAWTALTLILLVMGATALLTRQSYHPVVRTRVPDGTILTFLGRPLNFEKDCNKENGKVMAGIGKTCASCTLELAACPLELVPEWEAAIQGKPSNVFAVHTETQRILIETVAEVARPTCEGMAEEITRQGPRRAHCIAPATPANRASTLEPPNR